MKWAAEREAQLTGIEHARDGKRLAARAERANGDLCTFWQIEQIAEHDHGRTATGAPLDTRDRALERGQVRLEIGTRLRGFERADDALEGLTPARGGELDGALTAEPIERHAIPGAYGDFAQRGREQRGIGILR